MSNITSNNYIPKKLVTKGASDKSKKTDTDELAYQGPESYNIVSERNPIVSISSENNIERFFPGNTDEKDPVPVDVIDSGRNNKYEILAKNQNIKISNEGAPKPQGSYVPGDNYKLELGKESDGTTVTLGGYEKGEVDFNDPKNVKIVYTGTGGGDLEGKAQNTIIDDQGQAVLDITKLNGDKTTRVIIDNKLSKIIANKGQDKTLDIENPANGTIMYK